MDFRFTPEQDAFREKVRAFLESALKQVADEPRPANHQNFSPRFSKLMSEEGWLTVAWPKEYGGLELGFVEQMILSEELSLASAPTEFHRRAVSYVGPVLMKHGTQEQKDKYLTRISRGELSFCQLFSEPEAGSDLANLKTTARRDGDHFVLNGQKIWTSGGHLADNGILLARTNPDAPKHAGISMFLIPMKLPGLQVRPLVNMANGHHFNEVFFEDVSLDPDWLIGTLDGGWAQTRTLLEFERTSIAANSGTRRFINSMVKTFRRTWTPERSGYETLRAELANLWIRSEVVRMLSYRIAFLQAQGRDAGPVAALVKLSSSELAQAVAAAGVKLGGMSGQIRPQRGKQNHADYAARYMAQVPATIGGGTSEIQRNTIARRNLGLPS